MDLLIPKFHPVTWVSLFVAFILCLLDESPPNVDVRQSILGAIALGTVAAAMVGKSIAANKRQKEAIEAQKDFEATRRADIKDAYASATDPAHERLKKDDYGASDAKIREDTEALARQTIEASDDERKDVNRQTGGAYGSGQNFRLLDAIRSKRDATIAQGGLAARRQGDILGRQDKAADIAVTTAEGQALGGLGSNVASMQYNTPGMFERLAGDTAQIGTALASGGYLSGPSGTAGAGGGTPDPTNMMTRGAGDAAPTT